MKGAKTIIFSFVSIIALIGLVATLFAAYNNSLQPENDTFDHFSVQTYVDGFVLDEVVDGGSYRCRIMHTNFRTTSYAQIYINGRWRNSENKVNDLITHRSDRVYKFDLGGKVFSTTYDWSEVGDDGENGWWYLVIPTVTLTVEQPQITVVGEAWANVDGLNKTLGNAFSVTGQFIIDSVRFQSEVFNAVLPWNGMAQGSRSYIASLWSDAEETVEEWREEMNNGEG